MFELITSDTINGLTNNELKKELKKVTTAIGTIGKKTKEMAISISNIMEEESYKDDFKSDTEFAKFLGTSKGNLSKISRAGKLFKENENLSVFNLGQIEETLPLNDETRNFIIEEKEIDPNMTIKEVREVVNSYKNDSNDKKEVTKLALTNVKAKEIKKWLNENIINPVSGDCREMKVSFNIFLSEEDGLIVSVTDNKTIEKIGNILINYFNK